MEDVTLLAPTWEKENSIEKTGQEANQEEKLEEEDGEVEATPREDASEKDELWSFLSLRKS